MSLRGALSMSKGDEAISCVVLQGTVRLLRGACPERVRLFDGVYPERVRLLRGACPERDSSVALLPLNDTGRRARNYMGKGRAMASQRFTRSLSRGLGSKRRLLWDFFPKI